MFSTPARPPAGGRRTGATPQSSRASTPARAFSPAIGASSSAYGAATNTPHVASTPSAPHKRVLPAHMRASMAPSDRTRSAAADSRASAETVRSGPSQLEEGTVLSKDDVSTVTAFSRVPAEVLVALAEVDLYVDPVVGSLDVHTGFALLASRSTCYVWNFTNQRQRHFSSPICYTVSIAKETPTTSGLDNAQVNYRVPFCQLFANTAGREPGLIAVSASGEIMFWDCLSASIGGGGRQNLSLALGAGEKVSAMQMCEPHLFAIATTHSRLLRVSLVSQNGRFAIQTASFTQPRGIFGALFGSSAGFGLGSEIIALAVCPADAHSGSRDLYAMGRSSLQKWRVRPGASEKLLMEQEVRQLIASAVFDMKEEGNGSAIHEDLELVHAAALSNGEVAILFSHRINQSQELAYGIVNLDVPSDAKSFVLTKVSRLQYTSRRDPRPYGSPRLCLPYGGPAVFVVFADTLIIHVASEYSAFEETIALKDSAQNRFLGFGAEAVDAALAGSVLSMSCITVRSGSILIEIDLDAAHMVAAREQSPAERFSSRTERLRVKLEQAIFYGQQDSNPLAFALPQQFEGDLGHAAQQLSNEVVLSASRNMPTFVDTRAQLINRLAYLTALIGFIDASGLLPKLSQGCRRALRADAELAAAAVELWSYQNDFMRHAVARGDSIQSPLAEAIKAVMIDVPASDITDDILRAFFGKHLPRIVQVIEKLLQSLRSPDSVALALRSTRLREVNTIALTIYQSAFRHRKDAAAAYLVDSTAVAFEAWTAKSVSLDFLETLYHLTNAVVSERSRSLGSAVDAGWAEYTVEAQDQQDHEQRLQQALKAHLCDLAEATLLVYEERLQYLHGTSADRERAQLESNYRRARQQMIPPLLRIGRPERAFALAERHNDFVTLTELCTDSSTGGSAARIQVYLEKYRERFAFCLYQFYVEKGHTRALLEQADQHADLVTEFLRSTENSAISWLHDIRQAHFTDASLTLFDVATSSTGKVSEKKLMLSLSKLAYVADLDEGQLPLEKPQQDIELVDDQLDLVRVHEELVEQFREYIPEDTLAEMAAQEVTASVATRLLSCNAFKSHFSSLVKNLLTGDTLSSEDLVDVLTLKDTPNERVRDLAIAIEVLIRSKDLPEARFAAAVRAIWRRIILRDDWSALTDTTAMSDEGIRARLRSTALYQVLLETGESLADEEAITTAFNEASTYTHPIKRPPPFPLLLSPAQTIEPPGKDMLEGRLKGAPESRLTLLLDDYRAECDKVEALLRAPVSLERWWHEVRRLVDIDEEPSEGFAVQGGEHEGEWKTEEAMISDGEQDEYDKGDDDNDEPDITEAVPMGDDDEMES